MSAPGAEESTAATSQGEEASPAGPRAVARERDRGELLSRLERGARGELGLSEPGRRRVVCFLELWRRFEGRLHRLPLERILEELVEASGFDLRAAADRHALKVLRNLRQLSELVAGLEATRRLTVREWLDYLARVREVAPRREEAWVPEEGGSLLRILTIHAAKGLEFPLVVLADLDRDISSSQGLSDLACLRGDLEETLPGTEESTPASDEDRVEAFLGLRWRDPQGDTLSDPIHDWIAATRRERGEAENLRLLYVAMTRAQDALILSGVLRGKDAEDPKGRFLDAEIDAGRSFWHALRRRLAEGDMEALCDLRVVGEGEAILSGPRRARAVEAAPSAAEAAVDWEGLLGPVLNTGPGELSVTGLNLLNACPLRWILEHRLGLKGDGRRRGEAWIPAEGAETLETGLDGAAMGTLLHRILERWDFHAPVETAFAAACPVGLDPALAEEALSLLTALFRENFPWQKRLREGDKYRRELPFLLELGGLRISGQVDLVFEHGRRRYLVDWKSDRVVTRERIEKRLDHHRFQVALYLLALREADLPVDQAAICFLRMEKGRFRHVNVRDEYLEWVGNRVRTLGELARRITESGSSPTALLDPSLASGPELPRPAEPPCEDCRFQDRPCPLSYRGNRRAR